VLPIIPIPKINCQNRAQMALALYENFITTGLQIAKAICGQIAPTKS
jgi:hypothetical protein